MKHKVNVLGFLSLLALIAPLGWTTGHTGLYGFLGFAYYVRYFRVIPDECFILHVQKAATFALMAEMIALIPLMYICSWVCDAATSVPTSFALCFVAAAFAFTAALLFFEAKEQKGAAHD